MRSRTIPDFIVPPGDLTKPKQTNAPGHCPLSFIRAGSGTRMHRKQRPAGPRGRAGKPCLRRRCRKRHKRVCSRTLSQSDASVSQDPWNSGSKCWVRTFASPGTGGHDAKTAMSWRSAGNVRRLCDTGRFRGASVPRRAEDPGKQGPRLHRYGLPRAISWPGTINRHWHPDMRRRPPKSRSPQRLRRASPRRTPLHTL